MCYGCLIQPTILICIFPKAPSELQREQDFKLWERKKADHLQRVMQELREENMAPKNENAKLKDLIINGKFYFHSFIAIIVVCSSLSPSIHFHVCHVSFTRI